MRTYRITSKPIVFGSRARFIEALKQSLPTYNDYCFHEGLIYSPEEVRKKYHPFMHRFDEAEIIFKAVNCNKFFTITSIQYRDRKIDFHWVQIMTIIKPPRGKGHFTWRKMVNDGYLIWELALTGSHGLRRIDMATDPETERNQMALSLRMSMKILRGHHVIQSDELH